MTYDLAILEHRSPTQECDFRPVQELNTLVRGVIAAVMQVPVMDQPPRSECMIPYDQVCI